MSWSLIVVLLTQVLFSLSDLMGRHYMHRYGFTVAAFVSPWFVAYLAIRQVAMIGQLYVFSTVELGRTMALFAAASIIIANVLGVLFLREVLSPVAYVGVSLAVMGILVMAFR